MRRRASCAAASVARRPRREAVASATRALRCLGRGMHTCSSKKDTATQHAKQPKYRSLASASPPRVERGTMRDAHVL
eukprot:4790066-Prymnesium_polylepis.1